MRPPSGHGYFGASRSEPEDSQDERHKRDDHGELGELLRPVGAPEDHRGAVQEDQVGDHDCVVQRPVGSPVHREHAQCRAGDEEHARQRRRVPGADPHGQGEPALVGGHVLDVLGDLPSDGDEHRHEGDDDVVGRVADHRSSKEEHHSREDGDRDVPDEAPLLQDRLVGDHQDARDDDDGDALQVDCKEGYYHRAAEHDHGRVQRGAPLHPARRYRTLRMGGPVDLVVDVVVESVPPADEHEDHRR